MASGTRPGLLASSHRSHFAQDLPAPHSLHKLSHLSRALKRWPPAVTHLPVVPIGLHEDAFEAWLDVMDVVVVLRDGRDRVRWKSQKSECGTPEPVAAWELAHPFPLSSQILLPSHSQA